MGTSSWRHPSVCCQWMCHISAHGDSCAEHRSQLVPYRRGDTGTAAKAGRRSFPHGGSSRIPSPAQAKPGPAGSQPGGHRQGQPCNGALHPPSTQRAGKHSPFCLILLMDISVTDLLHRLWGWAGELTIKPGKMVRLLLVPRRALREVPLVSVGDSPWPGAALGKAFGKCL